MKRLNIRLLLERIVGPARHQFIVYDSDCITYIIIDSTIHVFGWQAVLLRERRDLLIWGVSESAR
jgi:hypothetical protein